EPLLLIQGKNLLSFLEITTLESLGLIKAVFTGVNMTRDADFLLIYFGKAFYWKFESGQRTIDLGQLALTRAGRELVGISGAEPNDAYMSTTIRTLKEK